jgi:hypothetical protein
VKIQNLGELIGKRVVVTADHGITGYMIKEHHLRARKLASTGVVLGHVPGHGGDVVWVQQDDSPEGWPAAPYCHLNELELYSDETLAFALKKLELVRALKQKLTDAEQQPSEGEGRCDEPAE